MKCWYDCLRHISLQSCSPLGLELVEKRPNVDSSGPNVLGKENPKILGDFINVIYPLPFDKAWSSSIH